MNYKSTSKSKLETTDVPRFTTLVRDQEKVSDSRSIRREITSIRVYSSDNTIFIMEMVEIELIKSKFRVLFLVKGITVSTSF